MRTEIRTALPGWWALLLTAVVLLVYLPALNYGLIWDDPRFYARTQAQFSLEHIFTAPTPPTYQFYRPLASLYSYLLIAPNGVVNAPLAHAVQIMAHLLVVLALGPALVGLGLDPIGARLAAWYFAIYPWSYFGVAWQQGQQPLMLLCLMASVLAAQHFIRRRSRRWLIASLAAYAAALLFLEGALPFSLIFLYLGWRVREADAHRRWPVWPLAHIGLAALYFAVWVSLPLARGVTGAGFEPIVLAYVLQGVVFPLAHLSTRWIATWTPHELLALFLFLWIGLTLGLWKWVSRRAALGSWLWIWVASLPLWVGLSWTYAQAGPRLLYTASPGIAVLWSGWSLWAFNAQGWRRGVGAMLLALVIGSSAYQLWHFGRMFQTGTRHLAQAAEILSASPDQRILLVNFPDQFEPRQPIYPLGYWGLILAPVVQEVSDYARALHGQSAEDISLASFITGNRDAFPYRVFMRGVDSLPEKLVEAAQWADAVYLTDYLSDGSLRLREVGQIRASEAHPSLLAQLGNHAALLSAEFAADGRGVRLVWRCDARLQPDDTIFVHFWQGDTFVGGVDGDSLGELIPPSAWPVGVEIVDVRSLPANITSGVYDIRVGIYNRTSGVRYPSLLSDGTTSDFGVLIGPWQTP